MDDPKSRRQSLKFAHIAGTMALSLVLWNYGFGMDCAYSQTQTDAKPVTSDYAIEASKRLLWMGDELNFAAWYIQSNLQFKWVLDDPLQTEEHHYLAAGMYTGYLVDSMKFAEARYLCQRFPPKADHFEHQANCIIAQDLPMMECIRRVEAIGDLAFQKFPQRLIATAIYKYAATRLGFQGHAHESIRIFKKAFESIPAHAENEIADSKLNLATAYVNPMLSESLQRRSIQYYSEVREWYLSLEQNSDNIEQYKWISYNKAIAHLFIFKEYQEALADLTIAEGHFLFSEDIRIFKAYAYAKSHQEKAAREALHSVNLKNYPDPSRLDFLLCYMDLTLRILGDPVSIQSCLTLKDPQTDVLLDLTATLATIPLNPREENQMWRIFYRYFSDHLKPDFQESMASAAAEGELQQQKAESRLKDLKLKNMSLYQDLSYALLGIAGVCAVAFFLAIRSWRNSRRHATEMTAGKARLQYIIDSIEEGLVMIQPGLFLEPEESQHLLAITGGQDLKNLRLAQLLALTNLNEDIQSITIQCLEAVLEEGALAWELNQSNLPVEARIEDREIAFYWQPLFRGDTVTSVLLVLRNITAINDLQRISKKAKDEADRMLVYAREILSCHPKAVASFLGELPQMTQLLAHSALHAKDYSEARRVAHNIKGTARTLGLLDLQNQAHRVEDELRDEPSPEKARLIHELEDLGQNYVAAMQHVLGDRPDIDIRSLFDLIAHHKPDLERQLEAVDLLLGNLRVEESIKLTQYELQTLAEVLLHGLTNAADHGFILPKKNGRLVPTPSFAVSVFQKGDIRSLILRDNGVGIDHQKILQLAQRCGWSPGKDQIWSDFLFLEGVTTSEALSMTSGRGVGMSAIRNAAGQLNGRVQLLDNDEGPGSMLKIVWPVALDIAA